MTGSPPPDRGKEKRADERAARVRAGLDELDRWLADQVRRGLAAPDSTSRAAWEGAASRLVDAQAGALANRVRRATELLDVGPSGLGAVLGELSTLHTLAVAGRRPAALDPDLAMSVRTVVGWTVAREEVLAGTPVTDHWHVVARSDTEEQRITVRRTWLLGRRTGRWGLVLDFAAFGQTLSAEPAVGTVLHADLHHFPGRVPIRALVGVEHEPVQDDVEGPSPSTVAGTLADAGWAIAPEPWLERWPGVVRATPTPRSGGRGWALVDSTGALPRCRDRAIATLLPCRAVSPSSSPASTAPTASPPSRSAPTTGLLRCDQRHLPGRRLGRADRHRAPRDRSPPAAPTASGAGGGVRTRLGRPRSPSWTGPPPCRPRRRAGAVPEVAGPPLPACPPDERPPCLAPAAHRLGRILRHGEHPDLLGESGCAPSPRPAAPPPGARGRPGRPQPRPRRPLRPVVVDAAGPVAAWLSGSSPGLGWDIGPPMDPREAWERGEPAERIEALRRLRSSPIRPRPATCSPPACRASVPS